MKLLNTWLRLAMALSSASAAASVTAGGSFMALLRAIERGTMPSISARREASPMADSMCCSSALVDADVARDEFGGVFELAERAGGLHQHGGSGRLSLRT